MNKYGNKKIAEELTRFLIELSDSKNKETLRKQANRLIGSVSPLDFERAESNLIQNGITPRKIHQLSTSFIMMGLAEREKSDLRLHLPDYHILRKVMAEHEMIRCFLADLEEVAERISRAWQLSPSSSELMQLSHIAEHLNSLEEHIGREDDVLFPALKARGWKSLFYRIESEHAYIQTAVDELIKLIVVFEKMPFNNFKTKLMSTVRYLCPLLREHLFHEDRVLFPLAISTMGDEKLWERLRKICNEIGYCGIHL
ncbi:MAG: hypothetical protein B6I25_04720 [Planctomycetales bacterium 4572_13]|nr:MAG: hypothetical protein B6I25_04720 [Planctomycetales bacterium 4572_13]